jgi:hypothetical protein
MSSAGYFASSSRSVTTLIDLPPGSSSVIRRTYSRLDFRALPSQPHSCTTRRPRASRPSRAGLAASGTNVVLPQ